MTQQLPRRGLIIAVVALCATMTVGASSSAPATRTVFATVADKQHEPVPGLTAADFVVEAGGAPARVIDAHWSGDPVSVVIILDGLQRADAVRSRAAIANVVAAVRGHNSKSRIAIMLATGAAVPTFDDSAEGAAAIDRVAATFYETEQSAPVQESVDAAATALARESTRRHLVFVMSDNTIRTEMHPRATIEAMRRANAELWAVQTSRNADSNPILVTGPSVTGGRRYNIFTETMDLAAKRMITLALFAYSVTYDTDKTEGVLRVGVRRADGSVAAPPWIAAK